MNAARALSPLTAIAAFGVAVMTFPAGCGAPDAGPDPAVPSAQMHAVRTADAPAPPAPRVSAEPTSGAASTAKPAALRAPSRHAVAAENPTAARIAMSVLERGGSAADAAIAGVLAAGVAQPVSSGIGGGGFAVVWDAKAKRTVVLDFREMAPIGIKPEDYFKRPPPHGKEAVMTGVPGEVAGLAEIHARWGRLAFVDLVRGAADAAAKGFPVSAHMGRSLKMNDSWLLKSTRYSVFHPAGVLLATGETAQNPALAATLQRIGAEGKAAFYEGAIAADLLETARAAGSRMIQEDLTKYEVIERAPLHTTWEGYEVVTMPPPSAGGMLLIETLNMHTKADLSSLGFGTGAYLHMLAETFRGAVADRFHFIGDPAFVKLDTHALTSRDRMKARRAAISPNATRAAEKIPVKDAGTSHLVVVDSDDNVVAITSTVNNMFGAKIATKSGFLLNDELDDFTSQEVERRFGVRRGPNAPRGRARPVSSMTPTIVFKDGRPVLSLGGSGGTRIPTGTTQVLLAHLVFDRPIAKAVADLRIETPALGNLLLDPGAPAELIKDLEGRGEVVTMPTNYSAVQAVSSREKDGVRVLEAAADPRKFGEAIVQ